MYNRRRRRQWYITNELYNITAVSRGRGTTHDTQRRRRWKKENRRNIRNGNHIDPAVSQTV